MSRFLLALLVLAAALHGISFSQAEKDLLAVVKDGKYGYINHEGKIVISPQFIWAEDFWRGLGSVYVCGRYASIDSSGNFLPQRIATNGNLEPAEKNGKFGFVDASGAFKIAARFDEVLPFSEGLAAVRIGDKWGFIDNAGKVVIHPRFKAAFYFREGVGVAETDSGSALIDTSGNVLATNLDYIDFIADGRVPARRGDKSGYLDLSGKTVIPFVYDSVSSFSGGLAAVEKRDRWGYLDRNGHLVIRPKFQRAGRFANGLAPARLGDHTGFIDKSGKFAFSLAFDQAPGFLTGDEDSDLFIAPTDVSRFWTAEGKFGYVNTSGRVIWGPTEGSPDHPPLLGWSDEDKVRSCEGISAPDKTTIAGFPKR